MIQMLILQRCPFHRSQPPKKEVRMLRAYCRAAPCKAIDRFEQSLPLYREVSFICHQDALVGWRIATHRFPVHDHRLLHPRPQQSSNQDSRRRYLARRHLDPKEQCASACAGFIFPHCRSLSDLSCAIRCFTSSSLAASKRLFMSHPNQSLSSHPMNTAHNKKSAVPAKGRRRGDCSGGVCCFSIYVCTPNQLLSATLPLCLPSCAAGPFAPRGRPGGRTRSTKAS